MNLSARLAPPVAFLALLLVGCGKGDFFPTSTSAAVPANAMPYHAFGDSITFGATLTDIPNQRYPALLAAANSLSMTDYAYGGDMSCDIPTRQIFANAEQSSTSTQALYSVLIGTNDVDNRTPGPYEAVFNLCHQASLAWLALPREYRTAATAATLAGATHLETANNWNAVYTDAAGASITFSFTRTVAGPAYLWYRIADGNPGTWTYAIDGATPVPMTTATAPTLATGNGTTTSLALLRLAGLAAGAHTLVLTQTSSAASGLGVVALGLPPMTTIPNRPRVLVGTVPPQNLDSISPCSPSALPCQLYTADVTANVRLLAADGLDLELFNTGKYMTATNADFSDNLHPNALGHRELAHAIQDIY